jgi:hypothetical protein
MTNISFLLQQQCLLPVSDGRDATPQSLSNTLLACAACAHWGSHVHQLLARVLKGRLPGFIEQEPANTLHGWAVRTRIAQEAGAGQQQEQELGQVAAALFKGAGRQCAKEHAAFTQAEVQQLFQAHMYASCSLPSSSSSSSLVPASAGGVVLH